MASLKKMREDPRKADILDIKRFLNRCRKNKCEKIILETRGVIVFDDGTYFSAVSTQNNSIINHATAIEAATAISDYNQCIDEYPEEEKWERFLEQHERELECMENTQEAHNAKSR
jgi:hypothetical protein